MLRELSRTLIIIFLTINAFDLIAENCRINSFAKDAEIFLKI